MEISIIVTLASIGVAIVGAVLGSHHYTSAHIDRIETNLKNDLTIIRTNDMSHLQEDVRQLRQSFIDFFVKK